MRLLALLVGVSVLGSSQGFSAAARLRPAFAVRAARPQAVALPLDALQPPVEVLYDGQCMVCLSNKALLGFFDRMPWRKKQISFVDIREKGYNPSEHGGVLYEDAMRHLHVVEGGEVTTGSEAVLLAYSKVGLGWLMAVLRLPIIRWFIDTLYSFVSKNRYQISRWMPGGKALVAGVSAVKDIDSASQGLGCEDEEECMLDYGDEDDDEDFVKIGA